MNKKQVFVVGLMVVSAAVTAGAPGLRAAARKKPAPHQPVTAPEATRTLGSEGAWTAYEFEDKSGRVCYLVATPQKSEPGSAKRKPPSAMVTHRPAQKVANVVSFTEGYPLKEGSEVLLEVGGSKFELFTKDDSAWARTSELDKSIVTAFAKGRQAVVKGIPEKGPPTVDTYSLAGFAKALGLIDKACGVKR